MGTLTADSVRLPEYCEHKLPTSCRLTSIPGCCACADERPHAAEYRTYIDGIGFVPRGTRWQRYCWFCKEFWANRVEVSGLRPAQTRIPEVPDQQEFLTRWYEFWQGYRITGQDANGSETRQAVLGEELKDVTPGRLPRTLEELRAGRERSEADGRIIQQVEPQAIDDGPSLEATIDALLEEAQGDAHEDPFPTRQPIARTIVPSVPSSMLMTPSAGSVADMNPPTSTRSREYQTRRVAALRRELNRMRTGIERLISGLRELGEDISDHHETTSLLDDLSNNLDSASSSIPAQDQAARVISSIHAEATQSALAQHDRGLSALQLRVEEARVQFNQARQARDQAVGELERTEQSFRVSQERLRNLQRDYRTAENYMRVFGTREQLLDAGEDYESPIGGMFMRAFERYRTAEQVRQEERTLRQVLEAETAAGGEENARRLEDIGRMERDIWGVPRQHPSTQHASSTSVEQTAGVGQEGPPQSDMDQTSLVRNRRQVYTRSDEEIGSDLKDDATLILDLFHETASQTVREALMLLDPDWSRDRILEIGTRVANGEADQMERLMFGSEVLRNEDVLFMAKIPEARISRAYQRGFYRLRERGQADELRIWNTEMMAQAYMSSSAIRSKAEVSPPERLQVLYRLQSGRRDRQDRALLVQLLEDSEAKAIAERFIANPRESSLAEVIDELRQQEARQGDNTRQELETRRRATSTFAIAAGRTAMASFTSDGGARRGTVVEDETRHLLGGGAASTAEAITIPSTRAATRIRLSTADHSSMPGSTNVYETPSSPEDEDGQNQRSPSPGPLDAKDTGRPEPKSDEEMTLKLDCKICYSQTADVACLPCGHLVMCQWCSEQHSPVMGHDRTRPRRAAGCPVCRKAIRQKVRVFRA
ncbi:hypothetical protein K431DRAFT_287996 [Polychaeton citri CBS 116435]|uniref:RING-type domain-containing protein n=1 Tax=Polychaeton citri CBS 116435 TaxID=1314669 RepID=A0A9P4Q423_9PEZI|nr:hypothetical protein K431DRAFT_287996 [Polychaeton citri CBS 116435]